MSNLRSLVRRSIIAVDVYESECVVALGQVFDDNLAERSIHILTLLHAILCPGDACGVARYRRSLPCELHTELTILVRYVLG